MRFMLIVKADADSEAGKPPTRELMEEMGRFNEEMVKAGVMLAGEGLLPSSKGARVKFSGSKRSVVDGPFAETKELIAGFWLIQAKSLEEAIEWAKRSPNPMGEGKTAEIEVRQVAEAADFPADVFTPEEQAREEALRRQIAQQQKS
ncbi:MAG TPA: YciI family protein [Bryobacteraceae bacterium]|nr:YciI family protein [Bryobacteraceae bacterium]